MSLYDLIALVVGLVIVVTVVAINDREQRRAYMNAIRRKHSAQHASERLRAIIAADRAAVPCWRRVKVRRLSWGDRLLSYWIQNTSTHPGALNPPPPAKFDKRPRYRYEVRR